jgi:dTDP-4-dehydrorhamnose reductase
LEAVKKQGARAVFFSSEYVFPGRKAPYDEKAKTAPLNKYGEQKVAVEWHMQSNFKDYLILRVSGVYGWALPSNQKNFVMQMINCNASHKNISAAKDISYNPTYAPNLGAALAELLEKDTSGIYHAVGEQSMSRYEFAQEIAAVFKLDSKIVSPASYAAVSALQPAKRPQYASLETEKLQKMIQTRLWAPHQALEHMKRTEKEWNA